MSLSSELSHGGGVPEPIRGQYSSHVTSLDQSEASVQVTWSANQCPGDQCTDHDDDAMTPGRPGGGAGVHQEVADRLPGPVVGLRGDPEELGEHLVHVHKLDARELVIRLTLKIWKQKGDEKLNWCYHAWFQIWTKFMLFSACITWQFASSMFWIRFVYFLWLGWNLSNSKKFC